MKRNIFIVIALFVCSSLFAQGEVDALRLSSNDLQGTARGLSMGGAFGALGGDFTGVAINPAGIAVYRTSELVASLNLSFNSVSTDFKGYTADKTKTKFNLSNISYAGYFPTGSDVLQSVNFGFNYNNLKRFNRTYSAYGSNMRSSLGDYIANMTEGYYYKDLNFPDPKDSYYKNLNYDPYDAGLPWLSVLGWQGYLINDVSDRSYESNFKNGVSPDLFVNEQGYIDSYDFTVGFNYNHNFYFGASFAITDVFYRMDSDYSETNNDNKYYNLNNYQQTDGSGYQLKVGAIWRPIDALRLGLSYHSPTWYVLRDRYQGTVTSNFGIVDGQRVEPVWTPDFAVTNYRFRTPGSWTISAAGIIGTRAIVSVDYELKDYSNMRLKDNYKYDVNGKLNDSYRIDNTHIEDDFKLTSTLRVGVEYRCTPQLSVRLGYAWMQNPYSSDYSGDAYYMDSDDGRFPMSKLVGTVPHYIEEGDSFHISGGIGYKFTPQFYMDFAFVNRIQHNELYFFPGIVDGETTVLNSVAATHLLSSNRAMLTFGYKF